MTRMIEPPLLEVRRVTKRFPGVRALDQVDFVLRRGEVAAVVGENGAGKSTLMKILAGVETPDEGEILVAGRPAKIDSPRAAAQQGIALIHQELNLANNLSVAANVYLGREPHRFGFIRQREADQSARGVLELVGLDVAPGAVVGTLPIGQQQLVEIAKALSADARVLIMDEPTSSLSRHETERLLEVIRELRRRGVSIIYISHRLGEVKALADRVVVLRDGRNAGELPRDQIDHDAMVRLMVGRDLAQFYTRASHRPGDAVLHIDRLRTQRFPAHAVSFSVRGGEIVGVAGLVGAGRTELLRALFGIEPPLAGKVRVAGQVLQPRSPLQAIEAGLALVPEDRKLQGLILRASVRHNITLAGLRRHCRPGGLLKSAWEGQQSRAMIERLGVRTAGDGQSVQLLSGGNQQKVVLAKWLALGPRVLLLDEPTRGIDVGAKREVYRLMDQLAASGVAILFVSSEMEEILGMSDRVLVVHEGRLAGELARGELSEEAVMHLATGKIEAA